METKTSRKDNQNEFNNKTKTKYIIFHKLENEPNWVNWINNKYHVYVIWANQVVVVFKCKLVNIWWPYCCDFDVSVKLLSMFSTEFFFI